jgi:TolB protein
LLVAAVAAGTKPAQAAFPGKNGKIAFTRDPDGYRGRKDPEIYTVRFDGGNLKPLTNNTMLDTDPAFSPDGKRIAFSQSPKRFYYSNIFFMKADGSGKTLVTDEREIPGKAEGDDSNPAFSPDGRRIAFVRETANDYGAIFKIGVDGRNPTRISYGVYHPRSVAWSPDGSTIAYSDRSDSYEPEEYVVTLRPDGSGMRYRTEGRAPNWSPDGSRMVFAGHYSYGEIYEMGADGTGEKTLMTSQADTDNPAFSPGGGKIVFESDLDGDYDLYVMDADGTDVRQLTDLPGDERDPDWQPVR